MAARGQTVRTRRLFAAVVVWTLFTGLNVVAAPPRWVRTWGEALQSPDDFAEFPDAFTEMRNVTLRQVVRTTASGRRVRVWISNKFGQRALVIGEARIAIAAAAGAIQGGTDRGLTFDGSRTVTIPPGVVMATDPADFQTLPLQDLTVSLYLPQSTVLSGHTVHQDPRESSYITMPGDFAAERSLPIDRTIATRLYLSAVDVSGGMSPGAIVTLGDSITDGFASSPGKDRRWPDILANRLSSIQGAAAPAVVNMGLSGNRLLHDWMGPSALSRFDSDVLATPGLAAVIVLEGINDIGLANYVDWRQEQVSADDIIGALKQLSNRAHDRGVRIFVATLTPIGGCIPEYDNPQNSAKREAVNRWIRNQSDFDGVIDFAAALQDPGDSNRMAATYDSGDHLHPNDAGYEAMAKAIDLHLFDTTP
jgi:lysophospholipase L1-like esterase